MESPLTKWESFYVIVGSSAGALTGLQFVVMALASDLKRRTSNETISAFATPNIVHFGVVLFISAVLSAPWPRFDETTWLLALTGIAGIMYVAFVHWRAQKQTGYEPVLEDWVFHVILPYLGYALLLLGAIMLTGNQTVALFMIGAMALLLMFVGIHNAWDTATFLVMERGGVKDEQQP